MLDQFFNSPMTDSGKYYPANIYDTDNAFVIEMPVAGFTKEDIKVNLEQQTLQITAELKGEQEVQDDKYLRREFTKVPLNKSFILPKSVDMDKINADYQNGILKITLPRREDAVIRKQIDIQ
ncbi:MAG TPA: Hsp20/alpha crystallin family protein [Lentimicrobium sp.]|nr:Hsp20/alpha crystallin family protein [Lentimicrobium sp.]